MSIPFDFLIDESAGSSIFKFLKAQGYNVLLVSETHRGLNDVSVLQWANQGKRILITNDKDFGELVFHRDLPHSGIILLRLKDESAANRVKSVKNVIAVAGDKLAGNFTVVTDSSIRIHKIHA